MHFVGVMSSTEIVKKPLISYVSDNAFFSLTRIEKMKKMKRWLLELARAVKHLHSKNIIHNHLSHEVLRIQEGKVFLSF